MLLGAKQALISAQDEIKKLSGCWESYNSLKINLVNQPKIKIFSRTSLKAALEQRFAGSRESPTMTLPSSPSPSTPTPTSKPLSLQRQTTDKSDSRCHRAEAVVRVSVSHYTLSGNQDLQCW